MAEALRIGENRVVMSRNLRLRGLQRNATEIIQ
jgi:hypothetical protein